MTTAVPEPGSISFADRVKKTKPFEWGYGSTPRTAKLRDDLYWKAAVVKDWMNIGIGLGKTEFRKGVKIDMDRARIVTEAFKETEGLPKVFQFARMVEKLMDEMPLVIKPGELIVGDPNGGPDEVRWYPETNVEWVPAAVTTGGFSAMLTEEERKEIVEDICPYWEKRSVSALIKMSVPEDMKPMILGFGASVCHMWEEGRMLPAYDYEMLFQQGLKARVEAVEAKLRDLDTRVTEMDPAEYLDKKYNWEAQARCGKALIHYAERMAAFAREKAEQEKTLTRRKELEEIASILDWVPANPPRTLHEVLQFYWIIETTAHYTVRWGNGSGTRLDQVWWPYYEADMKAGLITRDKAIELVECLMLKIQEVGAPLEWPLGFTGGSGGEVFYTAGICGTTMDGRDASNDLSCLIMEALSNVRITQPPIALRYHHSINPDVIDRAIDLCRLGLGHPSFFNEELLEQYSLTRGWSPEDAKKTQVAACVATNIMGKASGSTGSAGLAGMQLLMVLEEIMKPDSMMLESGVIKMDKTKDPRQMKSADELMDAFMERILFYTRVSTVSWNIAQQILMDHKVDPCNSFLMEEPMERGIDIQKFNKEGDTWPCILPLGVVNVSDSLAAIQKLIFEDKRYSMEDLLQALKANWEGHEEMRQDFLNAPKYGNDDYFADEWTVKFNVRLNETVGQVKDAWGYSATLNGSVATGYAMSGMASGASPDGRLAFCPLADGTRSPVAGVDKNGPTAVMNSASKVPYMHPDLFNQRFMPQFMEGDNKPLFAEYLREWFEKGTVPHVQFNVVSSDDLREAQKHPENHTELIVRVAGYSAHFIDLPDILQNSIIARTEQSFP